MTMSYRLPAKAARTFMVLSNEHSRELMVLLGYPDSYKLKVSDLRHRFKEARGRRISPAVRDYLTTLKIATDHLLPDDTIQVV